MCEISCPAERKEVDEGSSFDLEELSVEGRCFWKDCNDFREDLIMKSSSQEDSEEGGVERMGVRGGGDGEWLRKEGDTSRAEGEPSEWQLLREGVCDARG